MRIIAFLLMCFCLNPLTINAENIKSNTLNVENIARKRIADKLMDTMMLFNTKEFTHDSYNSEVSQLICNSALSDLKQKKHVFNYYFWPTSYELIGNASDGDLVYVFSNNRFGWTHAVKIRVILEKGVYCISPNKNYRKNSFVKGLVVSPWQDSAERVEDNSNPWE